MNTVGKKITIGKIIVYTILIFTSVIVVFPFYWMITTALDGDAITRLPFPPRFWPAEPSTWGFYVTWRNVPFPRLYLNTIIVALGTIIVSLSCATLAAYSFSKIQFRGWKVCMMLTICVLMIPTEVIMVPQFFIFAAFGLVDSYWAIWLPGMCFVFGTLLVKKFMDTVPSSIREAAMIDGASELSIFARIYLPLCSAILVTLTILLFLFSWNDLLWPLLVLRTNSLHTIQLGLLTMMGRAQFLPSPHFAAMLLSIIPVLVVYLILQRYIVASISMSGVKQ